MTARVAALGLLSAAVALAGCESTQSTSARLKSQARTRPEEQGLKIARDNPDVKVTAATVLTDPRSKRSAAVITLHNSSDRLATALPLLFTLHDGGGRELFSNGSPGAAADLVTVPSLQPGGTLTWIDDAIVNVRGARSVAARVGPAARPAAAGRAPALRLIGVHLERDPVDGVTAVGRVVNRFAVAQQRLVIYAHARRGGRTVAAGRAVVPVVRPGAKGARFTIFFVGDPRGAKLELQAPAVTFAEAR